MKNAVIAQMKKERGDEIQRKIDEVRLISIYFLYVYTKVFNIKVNFASSIYYICMSVCVYLYVKLLKYVIET